ncbi:hypothetical protein L2K70_13195 [Nocardioides KLBMP 9356]|uniref:Heavy-metal-associated domain-containing protein n=1 Tax=Nocardioides potassii TaxID=2911371 RepID=A0ABS9HEM3_9ACTN|nr:hypothetical protein [Nocardioides potassii]MCF6378561.1 hypothetical protein [Nocardioides potassii]
MSGMSTPLRVAAFVAALAAVFAVAWGAGAVVGPIDTPPVAHEGAAGHDGGHASTAADHLPGGLMVAEDGYRLDLAQDELPAGDRAPLRFRITGPDGEALTSYDVEHEKELHLIVVRRDFDGFQHVHPTRGTDGTWVSDVALTPGSWRVFADFVPAGGEGITLGADLAVAGEVGAGAPAPDEAVAEVDGYTVSVSGELEPGRASDLTVEVTRDGEPVTDLEPYLGAYGHLVALREGDLAYLHVHPEEAGPGPEVPFVAEVPSAGGYRLFFDFQHDGEVHTAAFAVHTHGEDSHDE